MVAYQRARLQQKTQAPIRGLFPAAASVMRMMGDVMGRLGAPRRQDTMNKQPVGGSARDRPGSGQSRSLGEQRRASQAITVETGVHQYSDMSFVPKTDGSQLSAISVDSSTEQGSPRARRSSQTNVEEYRSVAKATGSTANNRPRRPRQQPPQLPPPSPIQHHNGTSSAHRRRAKLYSKAGSSNRPAESIDDDDELVNDAPTWRRPPPNLRRPGNPGKKHIDLTLDDGPPARVTINIPDYSKRKRGAADDIDELGYEDQKPPPSKRMAPAQNGKAIIEKSHSLSKRGDIKPALSQSSEARPGTSNGPTHRFHVTRALCQPRHICDQPQVLVVDKRDSDIVRSDSQDSSPTCNTAATSTLEWLRIQVPKINHVLHCPGKRHVVLDRMAVKDFGAKLCLEFQDTEDAQKFVAYVTNHEGGSARSVVQEEEKVDRQFENMLKEIRAVGAVQSSYSANNIAADVKLMERNNVRLQEAAEARRRNAEPKGSPVLKRKLRDSMVADSVPVVFDRGDEVREVKRPNVERRALRSVSAAEPSDTLAPMVRSLSPPLAHWTRDHPDWAKDWRVPLTYSRTTIHKEDVARLDEGEFLNDSVISFYLHYLHDKLERENKAAASRFYFHNSFFYERLRPTKGKSINYDNVKSWTSRVDIFQYDYIVIPVNEHSHWWVAIICNPGKLVPYGIAPQPTEPPAKRVNGQRGGDSPEVIMEIGRQSKSASGGDRKSCKPASSPASPVLSPETNSVDSKLRRLSLVEVDRPDPTEGEAITIEDEPEPKTRVTTIAGDEAEDIPLVVSDVTGPRPSKKNKDVGKADGMAREHPVAVEKEARIVTLDSLGSGHSPACGHLKQYLRQELLDKKGVDIEMPATFGHTAKTIPQQTNYWDCGVYLISYIEALLQNPDGFIRAILHKESPSWTVDAPAMRSRIREVILEEQAAYQRRHEAEQQRKLERKQLKKERAAAASSGAGSSQLQAPTSEADHLPSSPPARQKSPQAQASREDIAVPSIEDGSSPATTADSS